MDTIKYHIWPRIPHLTKDTTLESDKTQLNIHKREPKGQPFPAGDHKAAMNRHKSLTNINNTNDPQKSTALERSFKTYFTEGF